MRDSSNNALVLSGIFIGASILIGTFVAGCEASAPEIYQGLCSLIGGALGAGGAALAVYLTLSWQKEDEINQTLMALYLEFSGYLHHCVQYHAIIKAALAGDEQAKRFMSVGILQSVLNLPLPVFFPYFVRHITRLNEPTLVTSFYSNTDHLRKSAETNPLKTPNSGDLTPVEMRFLILELLLILRSGLQLLRSSDFDQIDTVRRNLLIKLIEDEIASSPAPLLSDLP